MKRLHRVVLLALCGIIVGAAICYVAVDFRLKSTRGRLTQFEEQAIARAYESSRAHIIWNEQSVSVPLHPRPAISREDRARIEELKFGIQLGGYRRSLAGKFFTGGLLSAGALIAFSLLQDRQKPDHSPQPTALLGRG